MKIEPILLFARNLLETAITSGNVVVDAASGNGHDTIVLANLVGEQGQVYGFDIQEAAILNSKKHI